MDPEKEQIVSALYTLSRTDDYGAGEGQLDFWNIEHRKDMSFTHEGKELSVVVKSSNTGIEGGGEEAYFIFQIPEISETIWELDGFYSSWEGTEWDALEDIRAVRPVEKTIIVYEDVE